MQSLITINDRAANPVDIIDVKENHKPQLGRDVCPKLP